MSDLKPYSLYLFSTSRKEYSEWEKPEDVDCVFCAQAEDHGSIKKLSVFEDDFLMVELNLFPYNTGHLMVVPKRHVQSLTELDSQERNRLFAMVQKVEGLIRKVRDPAGINIGANLGKAAGESIHHTHIHLVPIYEKDRGFMETSLDTKIVKERLEDTLESYRQKKDMLEDYMSDA
ncbi:MAG: HIT domain-containing protein [Candidatus Nanohaloarchaea archaeon]|nr:HIT domain-containing protein [Candidatus Nanohaloarchaea archaeon]